MEIMANTNTFLFAVILRYSYLSMFKCQSSVTAQKGLIFSQEEVVRKIVLFLGCHNYITDLERHFT